MKCTAVQWMPPSKLTGLPNNPRKITQASLNRLCDSIRDNGFWEHRPMAVEHQDWTDKLVVLDGNQRLKAARRLKMKAVPVVVYSELTEAERDDIILRSNINNGQWELETLHAEFDGVDFASIGLDIELPEPPSPDIPDDADEEPETNGEEDEDVSQEKLSFYYNMMGDYLYPTDNQYEIPLLLADNQPVHLELPFTPWGMEARYKKGITTYHFYVDDYRFERLFKDPIKLLTSGCRAVVEPNCSIHDQTPIAMGIYQIYRKRYLARYLQECGMQVWVDLNVSHRFMDYNLLGVPKGYNAFFTRGVTGWTSHLDLCLEKAIQVSGREQPNMYVYGGGKEIEQWCHDHGLRYLDEYMNIKRASIKK